MNLEEKSRSSQSELNVEAAVESADRNVSFLDSVAHTCNKMLLCTISTINIYKYRFNNLMFLGFLPSINAGVSAEVSQ